MKKNQALYDSSAYFYMDFIWRLNFETQAKIQFSFGTLVQKKVLGIKCAEVLPILEEWQCESKGRGPKVQYVQDQNTHRTSDIDCKTIFNMSRQNKLFSDTLSGKRIKGNCYWGFFCLAKQKSLQASVKRSDYDWSFRLWLWLFQTNVKRSDFDCF